MYAKRAIIAGLLCLDVIPDLSAVSEGQFQHRFQPGHLMRTGGVRSIPGGAVANTGLALHRLGIPVRLVGKIGMTYSVRCSRMPSVKCHLTWLPTW